MWFDFTQQVDDDLNVFVTKRAFFDGAGFVERHIKEMQSIVGNAAAARAFTRVADAVNAEFAVATNEVRFLANANAVAMRDYDQIGQQIADLHVFVGSLKSKGESIRPKLEAVSRIETEVGVLERVFAKLDQHVTALEDRFKSLQTKAAQL